MTILVQGNVFAGSNAVSLSFSGDLNVLDPRSPTPVRTLTGHQNPITALAVSSPTFSTFISGDSVGRVLSTTIGGQEQNVTVPSGQGHSGLVVDIVPTGSGEEFVSTAYDDTVKELNAAEFKYVASSPPPSPHSIPLRAVLAPSSTTDLNLSNRRSSSLPTGSQPKSLSASANSSLFLATSTSLDLLTSGSKVASVPIASPPVSVTSTLGGDYAAVGTEDSKVLVFKREGDTLKLEKTIELRAIATALAFAPEEKDGKRILAVGLATGKVPLYDSISGQIVQARYALPPPLSSPEAHY